MNQAILINRARASSIQSTGSDCKACPTLGLPILPVRYAVAPASMRGCELPATCTTPYLDPADASALNLKNSKYVLRTLRSGFLYLHYKNSSTGTWTWQCFMISPRGALREIPLSTQGLVVPSEPKCESAVHNVNSSIISLKNPEKISKAYIAYSEHYWSQAVRDYYKKNPKPRFIEFSPASWLANLKQEHAERIDVLEKTVVEYSSSSLKRYFERWSSEFSGRAGHSAALQARMEKINAGKGVVLAIPDPIGCVTDLNAIRLRAVENLQNYVLQDEIQWKLSCSTQIDGLRSYFTEQAKELNKDAKPKFVSTGVSGSRHIVSKRQQTDEAINTAIDRLEQHYSEGNRQKFLDDFERKCKVLQDSVLTLDKDYVLWKDSLSLAAAVMDYEKVPSLSCTFVPELYARILAGGVVSEASLKSATEEFQRDATDLRNYSIAGILINQEKWRSRFQSADEKNLIAHLTDSHGKLFDIFKNIAPVGIVNAKTEKANEYLNKWTKAAADFLMLVNGSLMAVIADKTKRVGNAADAATLESIKKLESIQLKIALVHSQLHTGVEVVLVKIDLTASEFHNIMSSQLRKSMKAVSKSASKGMAALAVAAELRMPNSGVVANKLIPFTFWMSGTVQQLTSMVESLADATVEGGSHVAAASAKGVTVAVGAAGKTGLVAGKAVVGGAAAGIRAVRVIGSTLPKGAALLAKIPAKVSASTAGTFAIKISRHGMKTIGARDFKLGSLAFTLQVIALRKSLSDYNNSVGFKHNDSAWAIASSAVGVLGTSIELVGVTMRTFNAASVSGAIVLKWGGVFGAAASAVDCVQSLIRMNIAEKRGDKDAAQLQAGMAAFAGIATVAGVKIALGTAAFFGAVGVLVFCIGAGLALAYLAFFAEDTAVGIWLDRSKFGNHQRSEGPFSSMQHERDGLELVAKNINIELEWVDKPLSSMRFDTDEIELVVKRHAKQNDGIVLGVLIDGTSGTRRVFVRQQGFSVGTIRDHGTWPSKFTKIKAANEQAGLEFEAKVLTNDGTVKIVTDSDKPFIAWREVIELDPKKFQKATVWIRYYPNIMDESHYYDDYLSVSD